MTIAPPLMHGWLLAVALSGCSSDASPPLDPDVLRVAGTYATAVALQQSSCSGIAVADNPTTVSHVPGALDVTLTHASNAYTGTVQRDGSFATRPRAEHHPRVAASAADTPDATTAVSWLGHWWLGEQVGHHPTPRARAGHGAPHRTSRASPAPEFRSSRGDRLPISRVDDATGR